MKVETVWHQCWTVLWTLQHWCQIVSTLWHQSDGAKMSWVWTVLGPKCLYVRSLSLRVQVMILFCRSIALFLVFYAFRICIPHSAIPHYTHTHDMQVSRYLKLDALSVTHSTHNCQPAGSIGYHFVGTVLSATLERRVRASEIVDTEGKYGWQQIMQIPYDTAMGCGTVDFTLYKQARVCTAPASC